MSANQRQIPVIQTTNGDITQIQQNSNKVLRNLSNQIDSLQLSINQMTIIGEIKVANLTEEMFQSISGDNWLLNNGQACVDTTYARLTGNNTVPTLTVGGINTFLRVN